jgi:polyferredoxin
MFFYINYSGTTPGIKNHNIYFNNVTAKGGLAWLAGFLMTGFYVVLYFYDDLKSQGMPALLENWIAMVDPIAKLLHGGRADRWFLYGTFYSLAVLIMGIRMLLKYRGNAYQQIRTISVIFFQLGFAFIIPGLLKRFNQPEFYFTYFWPLKYDYLFPSGVDYVVSSGSLGIFMISWGIIMTLIATPVLSYFFGKRWYCSWVCGCGGLAETLGDPFRQHSSKSEKAWVVERWMIHSVLVFIVITTGLLWLNDSYGGQFLGEYSQTAKKWYGFYIGAVFSGVIGVGFYPIFGSRVWCRFGCPMAAILGIFQRTFSRFRITINGDQCMSCGNCSTYCEMGIDVRGYAQRGENVVRSSCVGCGVCAAVCPRGVLKLENDSHKNRFEGAENPVKTFFSALTERRIYKDK